SLTAIIQKIRKPDWSDIYKKIVRNRKRRKKDEVVHIIQEYIGSLYEHQKTAVILDYLHSCRIEIDKTELLSTLNKNKSHFKAIGTGLWSIQRSHNPDGIQGSLRSIVAKKLYDNAEPMHISELVSLIIQYRSISITSLLSNLKAHGYDTFRFF